jgi:glycosyltransferase involved in cell wall biosynthesis
MKVCHVCTSLTVAGAQKMLLELLKQLKKTRIENHVVTLIDGPVRQEIEAIGVPVTVVSKSKRQAFNPLSILKLAALLRRIEPQVIQGWMYHGCLAALLAERANLRATPVMWGIHTSLDDVKNEKRLTRAVISMCAWLSKWPTDVIHCSYTSEKQHERLGFDRKNSTVIANGFDHQRFRPDNHAHESLCEELGVATDQLLVGHIARYHPMKDHQNLLQAASRLVKRAPEVHFVLAGPGVDPNNKTLTELVQRLNISQHVHFLGLRSDIPRLMAAFNVLCTSSAWGESFPIVVGEAMASGVPCVVTDVGDSATIVGDTGAVVPAQTPEALAEALITYLTMAPQERVAVGRKARQRIIDNYSIETIVKRYETLYQSVYIGV